MKYRTIKDIRIYESDTQNGKLHFYEDIYFLIDTVQVNNGKIIIKPKRTFIASMNNQKYRIPIELKLHGHEKI